MPVPEKLEEIVAGCVKGQRECQKLLYMRYYSLAMSICMRYCHQQVDAEEAVNDSFLKIYKNIEGFESRSASYEASFTAWAKKIIIYTSIDRFRKKERAKQITSLEDSHLEIVENTAGPIANLSYKEIIEVVQRLSPMYRNVFNLYVIDGYKHEEIAKMLNISLGTSKSNLSKARVQIQKLMGIKKTTMYERRAAI